MIWYSRFNLTYLIYKERYNLFPFVFLCKKNRLWLDVTICQNPRNFYQYNPTNYTFALMKGACFFDAFNINKWQYNCNLEIWKKKMRKRKATAITSLVIVRDTYCEGFWSPFNQPSHRISTLISLCSGIMDFYFLQIYVSWQPHNCCIIKNQ